MKKTKLTIPIVLHIVVIVFIFYTFYTIITKYNTSIIENIMLIDALFVSIYYRSKMFIEKLKVLICK